MRKPYRQVLEFDIEAAMETIIDSNSLASGHKNNIRSNSAKLLTESDTDDIDRYTEIRKKKF